MSDDVTTPVSPYEEKAIDHADPREWAREPKRKPIRTTPYAEKIVDVPTERTSNPKGQHPLVRKAQRPELFGTYLSVELVRSWAASQPPSHEMECWLRDIIEPGLLENLRGRFILAIDGAYRRWTLYQIVNTKNDGRACARLCVFAEASREGYLPPDLDDIRFRHLRGRIGDFKVPDRRDFEEMRKQWDRRNRQGEETNIRDGATDIARRLALEEKAEYDETNRVMNDEVRDMMDYNFRHIWRAANNGTKQWSNETIEPQKNEDRWVEVKKNGYTVKCHRRNTETTKQLEAEKDAAEVARQEAIISKAEADAKQRNHDELMRRARSAGRPTLAERLAEVRRKKTL